MQKARAHLYIELRGGRV